MREERFTVRDLAEGGLFTALIAVGAFIKITIPVQPVPMHFTLQFFFVLLSAFILGSRLSAACVFTYLVIGLCGIPVFASGGGPAYLLKPTFGFLLGFAAAGFVTGKVYEAKDRRTFPWLLFSAVCGMLSMYACGMAYFYGCSNYVLHVAVGWRLVFINCFLLTAWGDFVLCVLAAALARRLIPVFRNIKSERREPQ